MFGFLCFWQYIICILFADIFVVLFNPEFISIAVKHNQEPLDPIYILIIGKESILIFINFGKYTKNTIHELTKSQEG